MDTTNGHADGKDDEAALLCWGCGEFGQHCQGHTNDVGFRESEVNQFGRAGGTLGAVTSVACGASHTVVLTDTGEVLVWGNGNSGQLGCGDQNPRWNPTQVSLSPSPPSGVRVRALACGSRHTMVLLDNGHVFSFGNNFYAQLGYNFREKNYKENQLRPQFLEFLKHRPVREVSCGDKHSLFLFEDGTVSAVGNNAHGQIGDGTRGESAVPKHVELDEPVSHVTCGPNHNLVITEDGDVYAWGYGKACGRRREDVLLPVQIDFQGRRVRQVAGGSTHSLALTAGGRVYSWGFGTEGQLGMGSVVMATKPRRLRHSVLEEGVSYIACGDAFSAAVTATGRLFMWGKNSHTIEDGQGSSHRVMEPHCLNPEPLRTVRHIACGAWHAAAVTGTPDPLPERSDSDSENDDAETGSLYSTLSSASSLQDENKTNNGDINTNEITSGDGVETSAPPQSTSHGPKPHPKRPAFPVPRAKTKLTIGEFYATSESASNSEKMSSASSPENVSPRRPRSQASKQSSTAKMVVVEVPAAPLDPESDVEEQLPVSTQQDMIDDDDDDQNDLFGKSPDDHRLEESHTTVTLPPATKEPAWPPTREAVQKQTVAKEKHTTNTKPKVEFPAVESKTPSPSRHGGGAGGGGEEGVGRHPPFAFSKSRTAFLSAVTPTVQVSRTPAKNYTLPREPSVVVSKNMDILDASQLLTSPGGDRPATKSGAVPGRPYGTEHHSSLHCYDALGAGLYSSYESWDDFDDDFFLSSPRVPGGKDVIMQQVPMKQIDGDFGPQVKRSSTFFGALSGHVSRSPTKFFRKPTPSGSLSRTPSTMTFASTSSTPIAPSPFGKTKTFVALGGGAGKGGESGGGGGGGIRPGTRGLGVGIDLVGSGIGGRGAGSGTKTSKWVGSGGVSSQRGAQGNGSGHAGRKGQHGNPSDQNAARKAPVFSSATSWRQRQPELHEDWSDTQSQSAPTSSKTRKQVAFADGGTTSPRSSSVAGSSKPTLGAAMAAVTPIVSVKPAFITPHAESSAPHADRSHVSSTDHVIHGGASSSGHPTAAGLAEGISSQTPANSASSKPSQRKPQPTLAYRTFADTKKDSKPATNPHHELKSVGLRSLLAGSSKSTMTPVTGQGRSRTQLVISGAGERSRRARFS